MDYRQKYEYFEPKWREMINKYFPGAELIRWGITHRVFKYKNRTIKIQHKDNNAEFLQTVENEFEINKLLENKTWKSNPQLYTLETEWTVLEKDWFDGIWVEDLAKAGNLASVPLIIILKKLFILSWNGIIYKQFRFRHILLEKKYDVVFIDFGGSKIVSAWNAIKENFQITKDK